MTDFQTGDTVWIIRRGVWSGKRYLTEAVVCGQGDLGYQVSYDDEGEPATATTKEVFADPHCSPQGHLLGSTHRSDSGRTRLRGSTHLTRRPIFEKRGNPRMSNIHKLRQETGAGMRDCKAAFDISDGNFDKAVEMLRLQGTTHGYGHSLPVEARLRRIERHLGLDK